MELAAGNMDGYLGTIALHVAPIRDVRDLGQQVDRHDRITKDAALEPAQVIIRRQVSMGAPT